MPDEKKKLKEHEIELTNQQIEDYFNPGAVQNIRDCRGLPALTKNKIFLMDMQLKESPEGKAFTATMADLLEREGGPVDHPETGVEIPGSQGLSVGSPGHDEYRDLMKQGSGIIVTKPLLAMSEFRGCSPSDHTGSTWIFRWVATSKEVKDVEKGKAKKSK